MKNMLEKYDHYFTNKIDEIIPQDFISQLTEVQQSRSMFQLKNFVIDKQPTDEMRYYQTLVELQSLYFTIKKVLLQIEKIKIEISDLEKSENKLDKIDSELKKIDLEETMILTVGAFREFYALLDLLSSFNKKYSREDIESNQEEYWKRRLISQAEIDVISVQNNISFGNIEALIDAKFLQKEIDSGFLQKQIEE